MSVELQDQEPAAADAPAPSQSMTVAEERPVTRTGAMGFGLAPRNFDEAWRMATVFAKSSMVPKAFFGKPDDILVAMQYGAEIGLPPMAALQGVAVINGKPGIYGDAFVGVIMSKPAYLRHEEFYLVAGERRDYVTAADLERGDTTAVSVWWRRGVPTPFTGTFSVDDAKKAKLWAKDGPWTQYPARQMRWRARGFGGRDGFAAELRGIDIAEALLDIPADADAPIVTSGPPAEPQRRSERAALPAPAEAEDPFLASELPEAREPAKAVGASTTAAAAPAKPPAKAATKPAAAAATPSTPPPGAFKNLAPAVTTTPMAITETFVKTPPGAPVEYEIGAVVKEKGKSPVGFTFLTIDKVLYDRAASCEGTETLFNITWQGAQRAADGVRCKVLVAIEAAG